MADTKRSFRGVRRGQEVSRASRREDTRTFRQKMAEWASSEKGTVGIFGTLAGAALLLSWAPFLPEILFITALVIFLSYYRLERKNGLCPCESPPIFLDGCHLEKCSMQLRKSRGRQTYTWGWTSNREKRFG
jgi:hypothetical protein